MRSAGQMLASLDKLLGRLLLAQGIDHLRSPQPLGLGLLGDRADHVFIEIDMFDFDVGHLDTPGVGLLIEDLLNICVEPIPFRQQFVEFVFAENRAQRGLRQLAGRGHKVCDLDDRSLRIDDTEVEDGIDLDRDIVARDHVLGRHVLHNNPQISLHHLLHERNQDDETRALHSGEATQCEDDAALIFPQDANRRREKHDHDDYEKKIAQIVEHHHTPPSLTVRADRRRTSSVRSLIPATSTVSPGARTSAPWACQRSPWVKTWPSLPDQSRTSAERPRMACTPTRAGFLRARQSEPSTTTVRLTIIAIAMMITVHDNR